MRVKAPALAGIPWAIDAKSIALSGANPVKVAVIDRTIAIDQFVPRFDELPINQIDQREFDLAGGRSPDCEIGSLVGEVRA